MVRTYPLQLVEAELFLPSLRFFGSQPVLRCFQFTEELFLREGIQPVDNATTLLWKR